MIYRAALYIRLSREDGRGEGGSIDSQRLLLNSFAKENDIFVFREYIDDGYSGTSYDRPSFCEMLSDIEAGLVNTVIVKDMSRLGRNYIETGRLTEVYFPERFVRLIAINDGYDSERGNDDMAPFRHVMNEMYARDISRKIRTSLYAKMRDGQYIGSFAPYGYKKSDENKNLLVPDPEAACVVRFIFSERAAGRRSAEIAETLNSRRIPVPLDYRLIKQGRESLLRSWTQSGVCKILNNQVYLGHTVQGKSVKPSIKSKRSYLKGRDMWIVVRDTHEPLVTEELFGLCGKRK